MEIIKSVSIMAVIFVVACIAIGAVKSEGAKSGVHQAVRELMAEGKCIQKEKLSFEAINTLRKEKLTYIYCR